MHMLNWRSLEELSRAARLVGQTALADELHRQSFDAAALVFGDENAAAAIALIHLAESSETEGDQHRSQDCYRKVRQFVLARSRELRNRENCF